MHCSWRDRSDPKASRLHATSSPCAGCLVTTRAFAAELKELADLSDLEPELTDVTDAGLANLAGLTNLLRLNLEETQITDAGLTHLERLTKIEYLGASGNRITDAGLLHLTGLAKLCARSLRYQVTDSGLRRVKRYSQPFEPRFERHPGNAGTDVIGNLDLAPSVLLRKTS